MKFTLSKCRKCFRHNKLFMLIYLNTYLKFIFQSVEYLAIDILLQMLIKCDTFFWSTNKYLSHCCWGQCDNHHRPYKADRLATRPSLRYALEPVWQHSGLCMHLYSPQMQNWKYTIHYSITPPNYDEYHIALSNSQ